PWWRRRARRQAQLFPDKHFARQLHAILIVNRDHLDLQDVADLADLFDLADILVVQFADVAQAVPPRQDLDERAKILDRRNPAFVYFADAPFLGDRFDAGTSRIGPGGIHVGDVHRAVVIDVDLGPGRFLNAFDVLATGTDQEANLLGIDLD